MNPNCRVSIIIPAGPDEDQFPHLLADLKDLPPSVEKILVLASDPPLENLRDLAERFPGLRVIRSDAGRAVQLNAGARAAQGTHFWFLHSDTRLGLEAYNSLIQALAVAPRALHYFNLKFLSDGPRRVHLNARGAWLRSHLLGIPFGDQGLCLSKITFDRLNGFPEDAPYGEDHLLVWRARQIGTRLRCTGTSLSTSARRYRDRGWARTTIDHFFRTFAQATPEAICWIRTRVAVGFFRGLRTLSVLWRLH